jgi:Fe-Mn family superoxide dismutase
MSFELIRLPYENNALEPFISQKTIELHHKKHLQTYVTNLNNLTSGTRFEHMELENIVREADGPMYNNAGQVLNHNLYFSQFSPKGGPMPSGRFANAIDRTCGSFENFQKEIVTAGTSLFGSGWVFLSKNEKGDLFITKESNAGSPLTKGLKPVLVFDVWEHSYYMDYQEKRADYLTNLWDIVDWNVISQRYYL